VNIRLLLEVRKNSTVIPAAAIQRGPQGTYVFVAKQDKTVDVRPVTIAFTQQNLANIASGLSAGEVVVVDGQDKLQAGSKIEPRAQDTSASGDQGGQPSANQSSLDQSSDGQSPANQSPGDQSPASPSQTKPHSGSRHQGSGAGNAGNSSK